MDTTPRAARAELGLQRHLVALASVAPPAPDGIFAVSFVKDRRSAR
jgi:hypothetical protein